MHHVPNNLEFTSSQKNPRPPCLSPRSSLPLTGRVRDPHVCPLQVPFGVLLTDFFLCNRVPKPHPWILNLLSILRTCFLLFSVPDFLWEVTPRTQMPWHPDVLCQIPFKVPSVYVFEQLCCSRSLLGE